VAGCVFPVDELVPCTFSALSRSSTDSPTTASPVPSWPPSAALFFSSAAFFRAAANAASFDCGFAPAEDPPRRPLLACNGSTVMFPRRSGGTLSHGVSAKKSAADNDAGLRNGATNGCGYVAEKSRPCTSDHQPRRLQNSAGRTSCAYQVESCAVKF